MPTPTFRVPTVAPVLLCVCGCLLAMSLAASADAVGKKPTVAGLRVVDAGGRTLTEGTQLTAPVRLRTSRGADCFGPGTGGSGAKVSVPGSTALGQLANAGTVDDDVRPLGITDAFDFGLGICRIGSAVSPPSGYWYLKVDHAASFAGADQTTVRRGDELLWYLIRDYNDPVPGELELRAPATAEPGQPFPVRVISWSDGGDRSPAVGATVTGAEAPTDARGRTTVSVSRPTARLRAARAGAITSNAVTVCTVSLRDCPAGYETTVGGTKRGDRIRGNRRSERILAGPGRDQVDVRKGKAPDKINCGPGRDRLTIARQSRSEYRSCERIRFRR